MPDRTKKRKPALAALLSLVSLGLGQIYNGEFFKGILLKVVLFLSLGLYMLLNIKTAQGLFFLSILLILFVLLKLFSIVQAYLKSGKLGTSYTIKKYNKSYVYIILTVVFLFLNIYVLFSIPQWLLIEKNSYHPFRSEKAKSQYIDLYDSMAADWPVESEIRNIDTAYGSTYVRISGHEDAPPLVLIHGAGTASLMWIPNIIPLSESFRTFAVDNIYDYGRSVFRQKMKVPEDFVRWLDELFDGLGLENGIHLIGMSYGGWVTSQYALHRQERLEKIVLLAPAGTVADLSWGFMKSGIRLWLWPFRSSFKKAMTWALGEIALNTQEGQELMNKEAELEFVAMRSIKPKMLVNPTVLTDEEWQTFRVPTLYMVGDREVIYAVSGEEAVNRLNRIAPHIQTQLIPDAGHGLYALQAETVNKIIMDFLLKK